LNRDLIAENGGLNLYAFVRNQPVSHGDFLGREMWVATQSHKMTVDVEKLNADIMNNINTLMKKIADAEKEVGAGAKWLYYWSYWDPKTTTHTKPKRIKKAEFFARLALERINTVPTTFYSLDGDISLLQKAVTKHGYPWDSTAYFYHTDHNDFTVFKSGEEYKRTFVDSEVHRDVKPMQGYIVPCSCEGYPNNPDANSYKAVNTVYVEDAKGNAEVKTTAAGKTACQVNWAAGHLICAPLK